MSLTKLLAMITFLVAGGLGDTAVVAQNNQTEQNQIEQNQIEQNDSTFNNNLTVTVVMVLNTELLSLNNSHTLLKYFINNFEKFQNLLETKGAPGAIEISLDPTYNPDSSKMTSLSIVIKDNNILKEDIKVAAIDFIVKVLKDYLLLSKIHHNGSGILVQKLLAAMQDSYPPYITIYKEIALRNDNNTPGVLLLVGELSNDREKEILKGYLQESHNNFRDTTTTDKANPLPVSVNPLDNNVLENNVYYVEPNGNFGFFVYVFCEDSRKWQAEALLRIMQFKGLKIGIKTLNK